MNTKITVSDMDKIEFKYAENYKNILDLYMDNSVSEKGLLGSADVATSMAEFALGQCAMVQNGNWAWSQISEVDGNTVKAEDIKFMPIYFGVDDENEGLCTGTENLVHQQPGIQRRHSGNKKTSNMADNRF